MIQSVDIRISPQAYRSRESIYKKIARKLRISVSEISAIELQRRSIDARGSTPVFFLNYKVYTGQDKPQKSETQTSYSIPKGDKQVLIVGSGPAGYFAALQLLQLGLRPIVIDRGKDVRTRRRDLKAIQQFGRVNPDSNYCFGEGGAGTYSDGKLYTRSNKRGDVPSVLKILVEHGAHHDIMVDAHPHIGSNKLPGIVANIRATIEKHGGQVLFETRLTDIVLRDHKLTHVVVNGEKELAVQAVILATGHSARDIYSILDKHQIRLEAKSFALGVRIEHPQPLIDGIQYGQKKREDGLPAASYRLACQSGGHGVFSFCMCPGGLIVPTATAPGEIVVNGMSLSRRDSPFANAGTVVSLEPEQLADQGFKGTFGPLRFQSSVEKAVFEAGDGSQAAPAQRLVDFVNGKLSSDLPACSYIPGIFTHRLDLLIPPIISEPLKRSIRTFGMKMKGYLTNEAIVVGAESRTSSPIRIPRDETHFMHPDLSGLFPCGEGAGYAGGILSAALDGQRVARAVARFLDH